MVKIWSVAALFLVAMLATAAMRPDEVFISEASGICRLGESLIVAGDENPDSLWVMDPAAPGVQLVKVKNGAWDDLEDLAAVDDQHFFAITSHSRTKKGKLKPEREQLLLIAQQKTGFEVLQSWSLRGEILSALEHFAGDSIDLATAAKAPPDAGGLNVEGLAYHNGHLFLGLRAPLTHEGEALVLRIQNANALLQGAAPVFSGVSFLPLGKKGVRSLTTYGEGLLVIAGSFNDADEGFSLHQWATSSNKVSAFTVKDFDTLIRPEAVVAESDGSFTFAQDFEAPTVQEVVVNLPRR